ncbi:hypothetical protein ACFWF7_16060 [Nocardia sp. NPDC060256]|uniref:hypothetical protein n=1 Tax=unclassified Nocardia TaxID=2637762 RepID=UPI00365141FD
MSDGFVYRYVDVWSARMAAQLLTDLESGGFHIGNPATGAFTELSAEREMMGQQILVSRSGLASDISLQSRNELTYQLWLDDRTDVVARVRRIENGPVVQEFGLDALTSDQKSVAVQGLVDAILHPDTNLLAAIVDSAGVTEELDWDSIVLSGRSHISPVPDLVALPRAVDILHGELSSVPALTVHDLVIRSVIWVHIK